VRNTIITALFSLFLVFANNVDVYEGNWNHYTGSIDGTYPIYMTLSLEDLHAQGSYYYYSIGTHIDLEGTYANDGSFMINEFVNEECTGTFTGAFSADHGAASGSWVDASGSKTMSFALEHIAGELTLEARQFDVTAHIPQFVDRSQSLQDLVSDTINALFEDFIVSYEPDMLSEPDWDWEFICDYAIEYYSDHMVSILLEIYEHTGGAHGNVYYICLNINEEKGSAEYFELEDLFLQDMDYQSKLSPLIISALKKQEAAWILDGSVERIDPDQCVFNIIPGGLQFTFAPYEVGPYAEGPHWVTVPYKKIKDIIDPRGPIGNIF
jgi:hypothetical protein